MAGPPARAELGLATPPGRPSRRSPWRSGSGGEALGRPQGETHPPAASPLLRCGVTMRSDGRYPRPFAGPPHRLSDARTSQTSDRSAAAKKDSAALNLGALE